MVILYNICYISYDFKMFGWKYENGVFSVVPVRYIPFLKISLFLNLLSPALQAEVELTTENTAPKEALLSFQCEGNAWIVPNLQFLPAEGLRQ